MVGNGENIPITHVDKTKINTTSSSVPLKNVLVVPNIKKNLLSASQLTSEFPYNFKLSSIGCMIKDRSTSRIVAIGAIGSRRRDRYR